MDKLQKKYFFIDESGDAAFYAKGKNFLIGKDGFQPILLLGLLIVENKKTLYDFVVNFQDEIKADPLYKSVKCVSDPNGWFLHARKDQPEIRAKFIEALRKQNEFKSFTVIGRKRLSTFENKHNSNESEFYFDLVYHLLKDRLNDETFYYQIFLSGKTGSSTLKLKAAVEKAIERDNIKRKVKKVITFDCRIVPASNCPEISVVDYLLWALQRYILTGEERFYKALQSRYNLIVDLYDFVNFKSNYYSAKKPFDIKGASEFRTDGYR